MSDGRKRFAWRIIKISIIILSPLSLSVIFYSPDIINLLGEDYSGASLTLRILLITTIPGVLSVMVGQLVYAYGDYKQVLYLGLASSAPRTVFYFLLVPFFGGAGAATGYLIGSIVGFVLSIGVARNIGMVIDWRVLGLVVALPLLPAFLFSYFQVNFVVGSIGTIAASILAFLKFDILTKSDVEDSLNVLPERIAKPLVIMFNKVGRVLNKKY
jgi:O-antigen/teichoic acid export membrane protein